MFSTSIWLCMLAFYFHKHSRQALLFELFPFNHYIPSHLDHSTGPKLFHKDFASSVKAHDMEVGCSLMHSYARKTRPA
ncbi:hypothetical protein C8R45DRAFT_999944 [Mycena sanguinolenta]|nr:hypothetical protein C8R45DRAFT_999944 [Mycena sanguinolenta]